MKKLFAMSCVFLIMVAALMSLAIGQAPKTGDTNAVASITKMENDSIKADLAGDPSFVQNNWVDDYTGGTSRGTWDTKQSMLADIKDTKNNKMNSEKISELKIRVHGDVALATYKNTYDGLIKGQRYTRTVICTDTWQRQNAWKLLANHCSQAAQ